MTDKTLELFLVNKIAKLDGLQSQAKVVMMTTKFVYLGDSYRTFIESVQTAWKESETASREIEKVLKNNPRWKDDERLPWFRTLHSALHQASSHVRPAVNSRDLSKIQLAVGLIESELSFCSFNFESKLTEIKDSGAA